MSSSSRSKRRKVKGSESEKSVMFKGMKGYFCQSFPADEYPRVRVEALKKVFVSNGGELLGECSGSCLVFGSPRCRAEEIAGFIQEVLSPEWISHCIIQGELLDTHPYSLIRHKEEKQIISLVDDDEEEQRDWPSQEISDSESFSDDQDDLKEEIIRQLQQISSHYKELGESFRSTAYNRAINSLKRYAKPIRCEQDVGPLKDVRGIGDGILEKIVDIVCTGTSHKLQEMESSEKIQTIQLFSGICGVGPKTARKWFSKGYRSLKELEEHVQLSEQQMIGIRYYQELNQRMSREEAAEIFRVVQEHVQEISDHLKVQRIDVECCGSYRRGQDTCGDVDILISHESDGVLNDVFRELIGRLTSSGFITDTLSCTTTGKDSKKMEQGVGFNTFMGVCLHKQVHRRIDIKTYPRWNYPFALIYFTGNELFNRYLRALAKRKGMSLTDKYLAKATRLGGEKYTGQQVLCQSEEDVFTALGLPFVEPTERNSLKVFEGHYGKDSQASRN